MGHVSDAIVSWDCHIHLITSSRPVVMSMKVLNVVEPSALRLLSSGGTEKNIPSKPALCS